MGRVWFLLLPLLLVDPAPGSASSGEEDATKVIGVLGGSATFQLKTSEPFKSIVWLKSETTGPSSVALLNPEKPCRLTVILPPFEGRLSASGDCRGLQVRDLRRGDSGRYMAQIQLGGGKTEPLKEAFELKVYKRLSEADLTVHCHTTENGSRQLNCSAGEEEEEATVSWAGGSQAESWGKFALLVLSRDAEDLNVTCRARNPVGEASRRVSVEETCEGAHGVQLSSPLLGVTVAMLVLTKVMASACVFAKWPCCPRRTRGILELPGHLGLGRRAAAQRRRRPSS